MVINLILFFLTFLSLTGYYIIKKRIDIFLIFASLIVVFFYPILYFNTIYLYTCQLSVSLKAKFLLFFSFILILLCGLIFSKNKIIKRNKIIFSLNEKIFIFLVSIIEFFIFLFVFYKIGFSFLIIHNKNEMTLIMGKLEPLFHTFSVIFIITILLYNIKKMYIFVFLIVFYDIILGFRFLLFITFMSLLIFNKNLNFFKFIIIGIIGIILIILVKETAYFTKSLNFIINFFNNFIRNPGLYLMIGNAESTSISAVFNEVVEHNFLISPLYYIEAFLKIFPFIKINEYDSYYKGILFGPEGDSFASGMFAVSYSFFGFVSYFIFLLFICLFFIFYERKLRYIKSIEIKVLVNSIVVSIIFYHVFRSDLIAIIVYIRSYFIYIFLIFILKVLLLQFRVKKEFYAKKNNFSN